MKKLITLICLLFSGGLFPEGYAQSSFGFKGGVNLSQSNVTQPTTNEVKDMEFVVGNSYGLVFKHVEKGIAGIQLELNYNQKGYRERVRDKIDAHTLITENIEIPFMTHIMIGKNSTKFIINMGPYIGFLFSSRDYLVGESKPAASKESMNKYEFGILMGIGLVQYTPFGAFQFESRFSHGLTDIYQFNNQDGLRGSQYQVLNFSLAYLIDTKMFRSKSVRK